MVVVAGTEADLLSGGGGDGRNGETTRNGEMAKWPKQDHEEECNGETKRGRMKWQDQERKNDTAREKERKTKARRKSTKKARKKGILTRLLVGTTFVCGIRTRFSLTTAFVSSCKTIFKLFCRRIRMWLLVGTAFVSSCKII